MSLLAIHGAAVVQVHMDDICHSYLDGQLLLLFVPRKDLADFSFELSFENCDLLSILFWNHCFDILLSKVLIEGSGTSIMWNCMKLEGRENICNLHLGVVEPSAFYLFRNYSHNEPWDHPLKALLFSLFLWR